MDEWINPLPGMSSSLTFEDVFRERFVPLDSRKKVGDFVLGRILGEGSFSQVRFGKHAVHGQKVAIKVLPKKTILKKHYARRRLSRETKALKKLQHPCIVHLHDVMETASNYYLVLDLIDGENFKQYLSRRGHLPEKDSQMMLRQIANTVQYIHSQGIVHRDLKPDNFIKEGDKLIIVDFGLSGFLQYDDVLRTQCGSPAFAAPEIYSKHPYNQAVDIWSIGIMLHVMLVGSLPFVVEGWSHAKILTVILRGYDVPRHLSPDCQDLLSRLLKIDPKHRASLSEILQHRWTIAEEHSNPSVKAALSHHRRGITNQKPALSRDTKTVTYQKQESSRDVMTPTNQLEKRMLPLSLSKD